MKSLARLIFLSALVVAGCRNPGGSSNVSSSPPSAAAAAQNNSVLSRLPPSVAAAFQHDHPSVSASRVHVRLFPDGTTHYQIIYLDASGQPHQAEYFANGQAVPQSQ